MKNRKLSDFTQVIWNLVSNFCFAICTWLMSWILSKYSGEGNYGATGILALAMSYGNVFFVLSSYGLRTFQVSDIKEKYSDKEYIAFRIFTVIVSTGLCILLSGSMGYPFLTFLCINIYVAYQSVRAYGDVLYGILQKNERLDQASKSLCLRAVFGLLAFAFGVFLFNNLLVSLLLLVASNILITLTYDMPKTKSVYVESTFPKTIMSYRIFALLREGAPMMLYATLNPLTTSLPRIILEKYAGEDLLGIFSLVFSPTVVIYTFATGILMPFLPKQAKYYYHHNYKKLLKTFFVPFSLIMLAGACSTIFCNYLGGPILSIVYDSTISNYTTLLLEALLISTVSSLLACVGSLLTTTRRLLALLGFNVLGCGLTVMLSLIWIPKHNIYGASWAMIWGMSIQLIVSLVYIGGILLIESKKIKERNVL